MVSLARQRTAGRVRIDQAALGEPLPYRDGAFDLIVCALAIHYASDRAAAFAEFCRVLRPGGAAVVSTQHPVMDWLRKGGSYFETTLETDIWHTPSGDQQCTFGVNRCQLCARLPPMLDSSSKNSSSRSQPKRCVNAIPRTTSS